MWFFRGKATTLFSPAYYFDTFIFIPSIHSFIHVRLNYCALTNANAHNIFTHFANDHIDTSPCLEGKNIRIYFELFDSFIHYPLSLIPCPCIPYPLSLCPYPLVLFSRKFLICQPPWFQGLNIAEQKFLSYQ